MPKNPTPGNGYASWAFLCKEADTAIGWGGLGTLCNPGCSIQRINKDHDENWKHYRMLWTAFVLSHEIGHNFGMSHDVDKGCGKYPNNGYMSGTHGQWSSCSQRSFKDMYEGLKGNGRWCMEGRISITFFKS